MEILNLSQSGGYFLLPSDKNVIGKITVLWKSKIPQQTER